MVSFTKCNSRSQKLLIAAPTRGAVGPAKVHAHCPWMAMNRLSGIERLLDDWPESCEVLVDEKLADQAMKPLTRMLEFNVPYSANGVVQQVQWR